MKQTSKKYPMTFLIKSLIHCLAMTLFFVNGLMAYADEQDNSDTLNIGTEVVQSLKEKYIKALQSIRTKELSLLRKITRSAWHSPPKEQICLQHLQQALEDHDFSQALHLYQQVLRLEKDCSPEAIMIAKNRICLIQLQQADRKVLETNIIEGLQLYQKVIEEDCPKEVVIVAKEKFCLEQYLQQSKYMKAGNLVGILQIYQQMRDVNCPKYLIDKTEEMVEFAKKRICLLQYQQAKKKEKAGKLTEALQLYHQMLEGKCQDKQMYEPAKWAICMIHLQPVIEQLNTNNIPADLQLYQLGKICKNYEETIIVALGSIVKLGKAYENQQRFAQAQNIYQNVLPITKNILGKEHALVSVILYRLASTFESLADYGTAKKYWENALIINEKIYDPKHPKVANVLSRLAYLESKLGNLQNSKLLLKRARAIYEKTSSKSINASLMKAQLANIEVHLGNFRHAESLLKEILDICKKIDISEKHQCPLLNEPMEEHQEVPDNDYAYVETLSQLAAFYALLDDYSQAELLLKKILAIKIKFYHPEHPEVAKTLEDLIEGKFKSENYPEHPEVAKILSYLATIVDKPLGDYGTAKSRLDKALAIYQKVYKDQPHTEMAKIIRDLASIDVAQSDYDNAKSRYRRAITIYQKIYDPDNYHLHPYQFDESPHPDIANTLIELAQVYQKVANNAETQFESLLAQHSSSKNTVMERLASHLVEHASAKSYFEDALAIYQKVYAPEHPDVALTISHLASLNKKPVDYMEALPMIIKSGNPQLLWPTQIQISGLLAQQNNHSAAIFFGKQAINILKNIQDNLPLDKTLQRYFIKDKAMYFKYLIHLLIEQKRMPEALQVIQMFKEEEYFDFVRRSANADIRTTQASYTEFEQPWTDRYAALTQQLAQLAHEKRALENKPEPSLTDAQKIRLTNIEKEIHDVKQSLIEFLADLKAAFKQAEETNMAAVRKTPSEAQNNLKELQNTLHQLGHGAVLVHYLMTEDKLHILFASPKADEALIYHKKSMTQKALTRKIRQFTRAVKLPDHYTKKTQNEKERLIQAFKQEAQAMYELLIKPIEAELAHAKTLMVSLDGALRYLPIPALYDGEKYMAERYAIVRYTQAAQKTLQHLPKPRSEWTVVGLGTSKQYEGFDKLTKVEEEINGIVREDKNDQEGVWKGEKSFNKKFTKQKLREELTKHYSVLHIASHFQWNYSTFLSSFLLLGDGTHLTLEQVRNEDYDFEGIELFTLSACQTGHPHYTSNGKEIEGFGVLAQNKGANSVIATLWKVSDKATSQFMPQFYRLLIQNPTWSKAEALRQTQINFIKGQYAHPSYWAAFILMGNWL